MMRLFACLLIVFLSPFLVAQTFEEILTQEYTVPVSDPPTPDLSVYDDKIIEVTIGQMRNALWYYDNYFIQRDVVVSQEAVIADLSDLVSQWESAFYVEAEKAARAERRTATWSVFGITTGVIAALMIALEFIDAYQQANSGT